MVAWLSCDRFYAFLYIGPMPNILVRGRVLPSTYTITTGTLPAINWQEEAEALTATFVVSIVESSISVACSLASFNPDDCSLLLIRVFQFARAVVDCIAFGHGEGLTVILEEIEGDFGIRPIAFTSSFLAPLATTFPAQDPRALSEMYRLVLSEPPLFLCLNDLIIAIATPGHVAISCARAVEGLRQIILPSDDSRLRAWEVLRHVLNLHKSYIDYITTASPSGRHGNKFDSGEDNAEIMRRSWIVMDRFLAFRKYGSKPLPIDTYPMLA